MPTARDVGVDRMGNDKRADLPDRFSRAAGPRARPGQTGIPPQQTRTGPGPRPARRHIQVRQVARTVWPGVTCVHARGAPRRVRPAVHMRSRAYGRSLARGPSPAQPASALPFLRP